VPEDFDDDQENAIVRNVADMVESKFIDLCHKKKDEKIKKRFRQWKIPPKIHMWFLIESKSDI
jgi:hypothetical protein